MIKRSHMSTFQVPVTLPLVFPLMALHHSSGAKAQPGLSFFSTIIFHLKQGSKRATALVWVLFQVIKNPWTWIHLHGLPLLSFCAFRLEYVPMMLRQLSYSCLGDISFLCLVTSQPCQCS